MVETNPSTGVDEVIEEPTDPTTTSGRVPLAAGLIAGLTVLVLGLIRIGRSFGYDEGYTYFYFINGGSVRRALTTQVVFNNHPMFSAIQSVAWQLGLRGETAQRLGPVLCGAVVAGAVVWYTMRRVGPIGGAAAGIVLSLNLVFLDNIRQLRGYALATMCVFLAAVAIQRSWHDARLRWLVAQAVLSVVAVTTHAYSGVTLVMVAAAAWALGRVEMRHVVTWAVAALSALVIMAPILDDMRASTSGRGNLFYRRFPIDLIEALSGRERLAVIVTSIAVVAGAVELGRRSRRHAMALAAGAGVLVLVVLLIWLVVQPRDLYFRFFITVLPFVAVLAGRGIAQLPRLAGLGACGVLLFALVPPVSDVLEREPAFRDAALIADRARERDLELCARHAEPMFVYTPPIRLIAGIDDFEDCEVYISVLRMTSEMRDAATARFSGEYRLDGSVIVFADGEELDDLLNGAVD